MRRPTPLLLTLLLLAAGLTGCVTGEVLPSAASNDGTARAAPNATDAAGGFSDTSVFPGDYDTSGDWAVPLEEGKYDILPGEVVSLESEVDGVDIQIGILRPDVPEGVKVPVIVDASPYFPPLQTVNLTSFTGGTYGGLMDGYIPFGAWIGQTWVPHGYAVAFVAVRGTADSGGCYDAMGPKERADLDQAITWLGTREWSNGNVGMMGLSYDGSTPWEVASTGNPHLKTIVPMAGISDLFNLLFPNGTTTQWVGNPLGYYIYYPAGFAFNNPANGRSAPHSADGAACSAVVEGTAWLEYSTHTGERDPMGYWADRNQRPGVLENYRGSVLVAQGFQDGLIEPYHNYPWVTTLEDHGIVVKQMLGQWGHTPPGMALYADQPRWDWAEVLLHWFDYWLKGDHSVDLGPKVQVQDTTGLWRNEDAWPPADSKTATLHLHPNGDLDTAVPEETGTVLVGPDPQHTWYLDDLQQEGFLIVEEGALPPVCELCASFTTAPFDEEFRFAGSPQVHVTVRPTGPTGHLAGFLSMVDAEGNATRLTQGQIDLRFADGGDEAGAVEPGEELLVRMQLEAVDAVVPAGHRLLLVLNQGSDGVRTPETPTHPVELQMGPHKSVLRLQTFTRGPDAFFEPPS